MKTLEQCDGNFKKQIKKFCPKDKIHSIIILDNDLVLYPLQNGLVPLGCSVCIEPEISQDDLGEPNINGKKLIHIHSLKREIKNFPFLPLEVEANLWFCPNCKLPINKLLPNFNNILR